VKLAKEAVARGDWPVVLADHSDRSGSATWILQQVIARAAAGRRGRAAIGGVRVLDQMGRQPAAVRTSSRPGARHHSEGLVTADVPVLRRAR
jgi:hypothetical protein